MQKWAWRQDQIQRGSTPVIEVGLFYNDPSDGGDDIGETSDVSDLDTEPTDGDYVRHTFELDSDAVTIEKVSGNYVLYIEDHVFELLDTTGDADHYFVVTEFQSDEAGDTQANKHMVAAGPLQQYYDLNSVDQLTNKNAGISLN